ncbi:MAG: spore germination protein [Lachnospirales bacterium]
MSLSKNIDNNIQYLLNVFKECGDFVKKELFIGKDFNIKLFLCYFDLLTDRSLIERSIIDSLMIGMKEAETFLNKEDFNLFDIIKKQGITTIDYSENDDLETIILAVLSGDSVLFVENSTQALIISTKGFPNRGIPTAENEVVLEGSRESFSEVFRFNTVLIRRRIRDTNLKLYQTKVGTRSNTDIGIMYMEDLVHKDVLNDIIKKLSTTNIDGVFDLSYLAEIPFKKKVSPFPQLQKTERPDKAASALLEGRIVIVMDNTPQVLILPTTFGVLFQSSEDYYDTFILSSAIRILRYISFFIAISLPGIFLAVTIYNPSLISKILMYKISATRETVPFSPLTEVLLMELAFELLREAGLRLPTRIGGTLGIVGGLIIGQSAVEAGLTSPTVVIIVALTAMSTFAIPSLTLTNGIRITKYFITVLSGLFGFLGLTLSIVLVFIHLMSLNSFGIPYMYPFVSHINDFTDYKDTVLRYPLNKMTKRPIFTKNSQKTRQRSDKNEFFK